MSKFSENPNRKLFVKSDDYDTWQCMDYKTFYMNVRKQDQHIDECRGRDKDKYVLFLSSGLTKIDLDTPELAFQEGYKTANELYQARLESKPKIYRDLVAAS